MCQCTWKRQLNVSGNQGCTARAAITTAEENIFQLAALTSDRMYAIVLNCLVRRSTSLMVESEVQESSSSCACIARPKEYINRE
jgi:hypothetical protein